MLKQFFLGVFMTDIPVTSLDRILRKAGCKRVSIDAAEALRRITEDFAAEVAKKASVLTLHSGRQTTTREDVILAYRGMKGIRDEKKE